MNSSTAPSVNSSKRPRPPKSVPLASVPQKYRIDGKTRTTEEVVAEMEADIERLTELRQNARKHPLYAGFEFTWQFPSITPESTKRSVSSLFTSGERLRCQLVSPIQTKENGLSHIWDARVASAPVSDESRFILKIFQQSMFPFPNFYELESYPLVEGHARNEAEVYKRLTPLQGDTIPFFFGIIRNVGSSS